MGSRFAFPLLTCVALAAIAVAGAACGDDDATSGDASDSGLIDSFLEDTAADASVTPTSSPRLTFVNAAHDLGPRPSDGIDATVRLCFATGVASSLEVMALPPAPDFVMDQSATGLPGVDQGRGVTLRDLALPTTTRAISPIVISSRAIVDSGLTAPTCDRLVGARSEARFALTETIDYWILPALDVFTLQPEHAYILALTGCASNTTTPNPGKCGPGFVFGGSSPTGNLALRVFEPLTAPGAQFLHLSTAANAYLSQSNERALIQPGLDARAIGFDAGVNDTFAPIAAVDPALYTLSPVATPSLSDKVFVELGPRRFSVGALASRVGDTAIASGRSGLAYATGGSYVFVAVGDPDQDETPTEVSILLDGGTRVVPNSRAFHFLGFPSQP